MRHLTVQQLSAFLDGALTGVSRDLVNRHLSACSSCRERHAMWRIYDEMLRRTLSWEPVEQTLEDSSARVELALTAERKGMQAPEFSSLLGSAAAGAYMPPAQNPAPTAYAAASTHPLHSPGPAAGSEPVEAPAYAPASGRSSSPIGVSALTATGPELEPPPTWDTGAYQRGHPMHSLLKALLIVLLAMIVVSPFLPDVIRVPVPEQWLPHLPRVEFVRHGSTAETDRASEPGSQTQLADRTLAEPQLVPPPPAPAPAEVAPPPPVVDSTPPAPVAPKRRAARRKPRVVPREEESAPDPEGAIYVPDSPVTVIPSRVTTEVQMAPVREPGPVATPATTPLPDSARVAAAGAGELGWPLLCGKVVNPSGVPVEGARVVVAAPALSVPTDRNGRFCIACPPGRRIVRIEAKGLGAAARAVELTTGVVEMRIVLSPTP